MKPEEIQSINDMQTFVEGCINDFDMGIMDKEEFLNLMNRYSMRLYELGQKNPLTTTSPTTKRFTQ